MVNECLKLKWWNVNYTQVNYVVFSLKRPFIIKSGYSCKKKMVKRYSLIVHLRRSNWISEIDTGKTCDFSPELRGTNWLCTRYWNIYWNGYKNLFLRWHKTITKVVLDHHRHSKHLLLLTYMVYQKSHWYWCLGVEILFMVQTKSNYHCCGPKRKT